MKDVNLELYKIFYTVGKYKNITKAANSLYISQPAITQQIKKLENELGYKLFFRTKYGISFTTEGEKIYNDIKSSILTLEHIPETLDKMNNIVKTLRIAGSYSCTKVVFSSKIKKVFEKYPDINIKIIRENNKKVIDLLNSNHIDIGIINSTPIANENIRYIPTVEINTIFVASPNYLPEYKNVLISLKNIDQFPLILIDKSSSTRNYFDEYLLEHSIHIKPKLEVSSYEIIIDLIRQGFGIGMMNKKYVSKYLERGELVELKTDFVFPKKEIHIALNKKSVNNDFIQDIANIILEK